MPSAAVRCHGLNQTTFIQPKPTIMKSIIAIVLATAALTLAACSSKTTSNPPPQQIDMGHRGGK